MARTSKSACANCPLACSLGYSPKPVIEPSPGNLEFHEVAPTTYSPCHQPPCTFLRNAVLLRTGEPTISDSGVQSARSRPRTSDAKPASKPQKKTTVTAAARRLEMTASVSAVFGMTGKPRVSAAPAESWAWPMPLLCTRPAA
eukprot:941655-Prymnesium_polylepis.1